MAANDQILNTEINNQATGNIADANKTYTASETSSAAPSMTAQQANITSGVTQFNFSQGETYSPTRGPIDNAFSQLMDEARTKRNEAAKINLHPALLTPIETYTAKDNDDLNKILNKETVLDDSVWKKGIGADATFNRNQYQVIKVNGELIKASDLESTAALQSLANKQGNFILDPNNANNAQKLEDAKQASNYFNLLLSKENEANSKAFERYGIGENSADEAELLKSKRVDDMGKAYTVQPSLGILADNKESEAIKQYAISKLEKGFVVDYKTKLIEDKTKQAYLLDQGSFGPDALKVDLLTAGKGATNPISSQWKTADDWANMFLINNKTGNLDASAKDIKYSSDGDNQDAASANFANTGIAISETIAGVASKNISDLSQIFSGKVPLDQISNFAIKNFQSNVDTLGKGFDKIANNKYYYIDNNVVGAYVANAKDNSIISKVNQNIENVGTGIANTAGTGLRVAATALTTAGSVVLQSLNNSPVSAGLRAIKGESALITPEISTTNDDWNRFVFQNNADPYLNSVSKDFKNAPDVAKLPLAGAGYIFNSASGDNKKENLSFDDYAARGLLGGSQFTVDLVALGGAGKAGTVATTFGSKAISSVIPGFVKANLASAVEAYVPSIAQRLVGGIAKHTTSAVATAPFFVTSGTIYKGDSMSSATDQYVKGTQQNAFNLAVAGTLSGIAKAGVTKLIDTAGFKIGLAAEQKLATTNQLTSTSPLQSSLLKEILNVSNDIDFKKFQNANVFFDTAKKQGVNILGKSVKLGDKTFQTAGFFGDQAVQTFGFAAARTYSRLEELQKATDTKDKGFFENLGEAAVGKDGAFTYGALMNDFATNIAFGLGTKSYKGQNPQAYKKLLLDAVKKQPLVAKVEINIDKGRPGQTASRMIEAIKANVPDSKYVKADKDYVISKFNGESLYDASNQGGTKTEVAFDVYRIATKKLKDNGTSWDNVETLNITVNRPEVRDGIEFSNENAQATSLLGRMSSLENKAHTFSFDIVYKTPVALDATTFAKSQSLFVGVTTDNGKAIAQDGDSIIEHNLEDQTNKIVEGTTKLNLNMQKLFAGNGFSKAFEADNSTKLRDSKFAATEDGKYAYNQGDIWVDALTKEKIEINDLKAYRNLEKTAWLNALLENPKLVLQQTDNSGKDYSEHVDGINRDLYQGLKDLHAKVKASNDIIPTTSEVYKASANVAKITKEITTKVLDEELRSPSLIEKYNEIHNADKSDKWKQTQSIEKLNLNKETYKALQELITKQIEANPEIGYKTLKANKDIEVTLDGLGLKDARPDKYSGYIKVVETEIDNIKEILADYKGKGDPAIGPIAYKDRLSKLEQLLGSEAFKKNNTEIKEKLNQKIEIPKAEEVTKAIEEAQTVNTEKTQQAVVEIPKAIPNKKITKAEKDKNAKDKTKQSIVADLRKNKQAKVKTESKGKEIISEIDLLKNSAKNYKTAEEFAKDYQATSLLDLSNPEKHRIGRLLEDGVNEDTNRYSDAKYTADIYGSRGMNEYKYQKDANLPDVKNSDDPVIIYRSTVKAQKKILPGDFVSFSKEYALSHNNGENLLKIKVPAKDVVWQGNDFNEWIYSPEKLRGEVYDGGLKKIWEDANIKNKSKAKTNDLKTEKEQSTEQDAVKPAEPVVKEAKQEKAGKPEPTKEATKATETVKSQTKEEIDSLLADNLYPDTLAFFKKTKQYKEILKNGLTESEAAKLNYELEIDKKDFDLSEPIKTIDDVTTFDTEKSTDVGDNKINNDNEGYYKKQVEDQAQEAQNRTPERTQELLGNIIPDSIKVAFKEVLKAPNGQQILGQFSKALNEITLKTKDGLSSISVAGHEAFHGIFDLIKEKYPDVLATTEKQLLRKTAVIEPGGLPVKITAENSMQYLLHRHGYKIEELRDDTITKEKLLEEELADDFGEYWQGRIADKEGKALKPKIKNFFSDLYNAVKFHLGFGNQIQYLYNQIEKGAFVNGKELKTDAQVSDALKKAKREVKMSSWIGNMIHLVDSNFAAKEVITEKGSPEAKAKYNEKNAYINQLVVEATDLGFKVVAGTDIYKGIKIGTINIETPRGVISFHVPTLERNAETGKAVFKTKNFEGQDVQTTLKYDPNYRMLERNKEIINERGLTEPGGRNKLISEQKKMFAITNNFNEAKINLLDKDLRSGLLNSSVTTDRVSNAQDISFKREKDNAILDNSDLTTQNTNKVKPQNTLYDYINSSPKATIQPERSGSRVYISDAARTGERFNEAGNVSSKASNNLFPTKFQRSNRSELAKAGEVSNTTFQDEAGQLQKTVGQPEFETKNSNLNKTTRSLRAKEFRELEIFGETFFKKLEILKNNDTLDTLSNKNEYTRLTNEVNYKLVLHNFSNQKIILSKIAPEFIKTFDALDSYSNGYLSTRVKQFSFIDAEARESTKASYSPEESKISLNLFDLATNVHELSHALFDQTIKDIITKKFEDNSFALFFNFVNYSKYKNDSSPTNRYFAYLGQAIKYTPKEQLRENTIAYNTLSLGFKDLTKAQIQELNDKIYQNLGEVGQNLLHTEYFAHQQELLFLEGKFEAFTNNIQQNSVFFNSEKGKYFSTNILNPEKLQENNKKNRDETTPEGKLANIQQQFAQKYTIGGKGYKAVVEAYNNDKAIDSGKLFDDLPKDQQTKLLDQARLEEMKTILNDDNIAVFLSSSSKQGKDNIEQVDGTTRKFNETEIDKIFNSVKEVKPDSVNIKGGNAFQNFFRDFRSISGAVKRFTKGLNYMGKEIAGAAENNILGLIDVGSKENATPIANLWVEFEKEMSKFDPETRKQIKENSILIYAIDSKGETANRPTTFGVNVEDFNDLQTQYKKMSTGENADTFVDLYYYTKNGQQQSIKSILEKLTKDPKSDNPLIDKNGSLLKQNFIVKSKIKPDLLDAMHAQYMGLPQNVKNGIKALRKAYNLQGEIAQDRQITKGASENYGPAYLKIENALNLEDASNGSKISIGSKITSFNDMAKLVGDKVVTEGYFNPYEAIPKELTRLSNIIHKKVTFETLKALTDKAGRKLLIKKFEYLNLSDSEKLQYDQNILGFENNQHIIVKIKGEDYYINPFLKKYFYEPKNITLLDNNGALRAFQQLTNIGTSNTFSGIGSAAKNTFQEGFGLVFDKFSSEVILNAGSLAGNKIGKGGKRDLQSHVNDYLDANIASLNPENLLDIDTDPTFTSIGAGDKVDQVVKTGLDVARKTVGTSPFFIGNLAKKVYDPIASEKIKSRIVDLIKAAGIDANKATLEDVRTALLQARNLGIIKPLELGSINSKKVRSILTKYAVPVSVGLAFMTGGTSLVLPIGFAVSAIYNLETLGSNIKNYKQFSKAEKIVLQGQVLSEVLKVAATLAIMAYIKGADDRKKNRDINKALRGSKRSDPFDTGLGMIDDLLTATVNIGNVNVNLSELIPNNGLTGLIYLASVANEQYRAVANLDSKTPDDRNAVLKVTSALLKTANSTFVPKIVDQIISVISGYVDPRDLKGNNTNAISDVKPELTKILGKIFNQDPKNVGLVQKENIRMLEDALGRFKENKTPAVINPNDNLIKILTGSTIQNPDDAANNINATNQQLANTKATIQRDLANGKITQDEADKKYKALEKQANLAGTTTDNITAEFKPGGGGSSKSSSGGGVKSSSKFKSSIKSDLKAQNKITASIANSQSRINKAKLAATKARTKVTKSKTLKVAKAPKPASSKFRAGVKLSSSKSSSVKFSSPKITVPKFKAVKSPSYKPITFKQTKISNIGSSKTGAVRSGIRFNANPITAKQIKIAKARK
jgi:hypothetical protein